MKRSVWMAASAAVALSVVPLPIRALRTQLRLPSRRRRRPLTPRLTLLSPIRPPPLSPILETTRPTLRPLPRVTATRPPLRRRAPTMRPLSRTSRRLRPSSLRWVLRGARATRVTRELLSSPRRTRVAPPRPRRPPPSSRRPRVRRLRSPQRVLLPAPERVPPRALPRLPTSRLLPPRVAPPMPTAPPLRRPARGRPPPGWRWALVLRAPPCSWLVVG